MALKYVDYRIVAHAVAAAVAVDFEEPASVIDVWNLRQEVDGREVPPYLLERQDVLVMALAHKTVVLVVSSPAGRGGGKGKAIVFEGLAAAYLLDT